MPRLRTVTSAAAAAAAIGASLMFGATPGSGAPAARQAPQPGWHHYHEQGWVDPAGNPCRFKVRARIVRQDVVYKTLTRYQNGKPFVQEWRGPLRLRFINARTGTSVVRGASGTAFFTYGKDGSLVIPWRGGGSITSHTGNQGLRPGEWIFTGAYIVRIGPKGNKHVRQFTGTRENLCHTLAG